MQRGYWQTAAEHGAQVTVLEKMFKPGKKLLITGKGRCNITNDCDLQEIIKNIPGNGRFLNSALRQFTNEDVVKLLNDNGLETKVERGGRVFPVSDQAKDVVDTLLKILHDLGVELVTDICVTEVLTDTEKVIGVKTKSGKKYLKQMQLLLQQAGRLIQEPDLTGVDLNLPKNWDMR